MSNHSLFIHGADGVAEPATSEQILGAARQVLAHRVRRGATLSSPQKVREYLSMRLGHLDYEMFALILVNQNHRVIAMQQRVPANAKPGHEFRNDTERLEKLFDMYVKMTAGADAAKKQRTRARA